MDARWMALGAGLALALGAGCPDADRSEPAAAEPGAERTVREDALRVAGALGDPAPGTMGALAPPSGVVRVEVRQALVETDERLAETLADAAALRAWTERLAAELSCPPDAGCRWPGGLVVQGPPRCFGDCCDWGTDARRVQEGTLRLTRVCLAAREAGERRLTYLGFVEAR